MRRTDVGFGGGNSSGWPATIPVACVDGAGAKGYLHFDGGDGR